MEAHLKTVWPQSMFGAAPRAEVEMGRHGLAGEIAPGTESGDLVEAGPAGQVFISFSLTDT